MTDVLIYRSARINEAEAAAAASIVDLNVPSLYGGGDQPAPLHRVAPNESINGPKGVFESRIGSCTVGWGAFVFGEQRRIRVPLNFMT